MEVDNLLVVILGFFLFFDSNFEFNVCYYIVVFGILNVKLIIKFI